MTNPYNEGARRFVDECRRLGVNHPPHFELWQNAENVKWIAVTAGMHRRQVMYSMKMNQGADEAQQVEALLNLKREVESLLKQ